MDRCKKAMSNTCKSHVEFSKWIESNSKDQQNKIIPIPEEKETFYLRNKYEYFI